MLRTPHPFDLCGARGTAGRFCPKSRRSRSGSRGCPTRPRSTSRCRPSVSWARTPRWSSTRVDISTMTCTERSALLLRSPRARSSFARARLVIRHVVFLRTASSVASSAMGSAGTITSALRGIPSDLAAALHHPDLEYHQPSFNRPTVNALCRSVPMPLPLNSLARPWSKPDDAKYDAAFCLSSNPLSSCEARRANMLPLLVDR